MAGKCQEEDLVEVPEVEKMLALDSLSFGEKGRVVETCNARERLNGRAEEMNEAVVEEMEVYSAAYALMAGEKEGHSVSKKAVERQEALEEWL